MLEKYKSELTNLPKGCIAEKKNGKKIYYYLKFREGRHIISRYVRKSNVENLQERLNRRKHIEVMIRSLHKEREITEKALEANI